MTDELPPEKQLWLGEWIRNVSLSISAAGLAGLITGVGAAAALGLTGGIGLLFGQGMMHVGRAGLEGGETA